MAEVETPAQTLDRFLRVLAGDPNVEGVFAGGSMARGDSDEVSDLDLWVKGEQWSPECLGALLLSAEVTSLGGIPFLSGVSTGGTIVDILYGPEPWAHYVPIELPDPEPIGPAPVPVPGLVEEFWSMSLKHRKNLWRGNYGFLTFGLNLDRQYLLRAWVASETGADPGPSAFSIFGLKRIFEDHVDSGRLALLGLPLRNEEEILSAVEQYRDEMSRLFPEQTELERVARSMPLKPRYQPHRPSDSRAEKIAGRWEDVAKPDGQRDSN